MYKCEQCGCMTFDRVMLDNGLKVCEYCECEDTKQKQLAKAAKVHKTREYGNLAWFIRLDHKTIRNWAKKNGFEYSMVEKIIHRKEPYNRSDIHSMTEKHFAVVMAMCDSGYRDILVNERYITHV